MKARQKEDWGDRAGPPKPPGTSWSPLIDTGLGRMDTVPSPLWGGLGWGFVPHSEIS